MINNNNALPLTVLAAVNFTLDLPPVDTNPVGHISRVYSLDSAPILPKTVVVIGCGEGSGIRALDGIFEFTGVTDHDWRALKYTRASGMANSAMFKQTCLGDPEYGSWVKSLKPEVITGNTSRRTSELEEGPQCTAGASTTIV